MAKLFENSGDPVQTSRSAASDLDLHYMPTTNSALNFTTVLSTSFGKTFFFAWRYILNDNVFF